MQKGKRCKTTGKFCFIDKKVAEQVADELAQINWEKGEDSWVDVFLCQDCKKYHLGRLERRPRDDSQAPLHKYKHLLGPYDKKSKIRAGNLRTYHDLEQSHRSTPKHRRRFRRRH